MACARPECCRTVPAVTTPLLLAGPDGDLLVAGIDCETSGNDLARGARMIQIGLAVGSGSDLDVFSSLVGWSDESWDTDSWSTEAETVHGITRARLAQAPDADAVDALAATWLLRHGARADRPAVLAVGFNVGSFDLPFIARYLPRTRALLTHRCVDLNSVLFTLDGWHPTESDGWGWHRWKSTVKEHAAAALHAHAGGAHDAGWDAAEAMLSWQWLRDRLPAPGATREDLP